MGYFMILLMLLVIAIIACYFLKNGMYELTDAIVFLIMTSLPLGFIIGMIYEISNN